MQVTTQKSGRALLLAATLSLGLASGFATQVFAAEALLKAPVAKPLSTEIDGRVWKCEADKCEGNGDGASQSLKRECGHVAAELGALKTYSSENGKLADASVCSTK